MKNLVLSFIVSSLLMKVFILLLFEVSFTIESLSEDHTLKESCKICLRKDVIFDAGLTYTEM